MRTAKTLARVALTCAGLALGTTACGNGIPIQLRIDQFTSSIDFDNLLTQMEAKLQSQGVVPGGVHLPETWPSTLPPVHFVTTLQSPAFAVDLSSSSGSLAQFNQYRKVLDRVEINDLVLRLEENTLSLPLPALEVQVASGLNVNPDDIANWVTVGALPTASPQAVTDLDFKFVPGGESFVDEQIGGADAQFSLRTNGVFDYDTSLEPQTPRGTVTLRLIIVATIFVALEKL